MLSSLGSLSGALAAVLSANAAWLAHFARSPLAEVEMRESTTWWRGLGGHGSAWSSARDW
jgi:hypothetical protein